MELCRIIIIIIIVVVVVVVQESKQLTVYVTRVLLTFWHPNFTFKF